MITNAIVCENKMDSSSKNFVVGWMDGWMDGWKKFLFQELYHISSAEQLTALYKACK